MSKNLYKKIYWPNSVFTIPNFLNLQRSSFEDFLKNGLITEFENINKIRNSSQTIEIIFHANKYKLNPPVLTPKQAILKHKTYACHLFVPVQITNYKTKQVILKWFFLANLPLMTKSGHFILNGSPKIIMNQIVRSPGIYFHKSVKADQQITYEADFIAQRGAWLRLEIDNKKGEIWAKLKGTPKIPVFVFLRCLGLKLPCLNNYVYLTQSQHLESKKISVGQGVLSNLTEPQTKIQNQQNLNSSINLIYNIFDLLQKSELSKNSTINLSYEPNITFSNSQQLFTNFCQILYPKSQNNNIEFEKTSKKFLYSKFLNPRVYNLSPLGRYRINQKLGLDVAENHNVLTAKDILFACFYLIECLEGTQSPTDIDDLKNRKIKSSGELLQIQFATGLLRFEKTIRQKLILSEKLRKNILFSSSLKFNGLTNVKPLNSRLTLSKVFPNSKLQTTNIDMLKIIDSSNYFGENDSLVLNLNTQFSLNSNQTASKYMSSKNFKNRKTFGGGYLAAISDRSKQNLKQNQKLESLLSPKPINSALREFFGTNPLAQLLDQTNPLSELTHKRRLSCLGPGGISRDTAGMAIRTIHPTYYGRICPIETPEGQNAGLVNSFTIYSNLNKKGFVETPFYKTYKGFVLKNQDAFLFSSDQEKFFNLAPGDIRTTVLNFLPNNVNIPTRQLKEFKRVPRKYINFMALEPIQMISVATSLIPFLEHNDGNRALMGSNMQRQAVPLLVTSKPIVATGLESRVIADVNQCLQAKKSGFVAYVDGKKIITYSYYPNFSVKVCDLKNTKFSSKTKNKKFNFIKTSLISQPKKSRQKLKAVVQKNSALSQNFYKNRLLKTHLPLKFILTNNKTTQKFQDLSKKQRNVNRVHKYEKFLIDFKNIYFQSSCVNNILKENILNKKQNNAFLNHELFGYNPFSCKIKILKLNTLNYECTKNFISLNKICNSKSIFYSNNFKIQPLKHFQSRLKYEHEQFFKEFYLKSFNHYWKRTTNFKRNFKQKYENGYKSNLILNNFKTKTFYKVTNLLFENNFLGLWELFKFCSSKPIYCLETKKYKPFLSNRCLRLIKQYSNKTVLLNYAYIILTLMLNKNVTTNFRFNQVLTKQNYLNQEKNFYVKYKNKDYFLQKTIDRKIEGGYLAAENVVFGQNLNIKKDLILQFLKSKKTFFSNFKSSNSQNEIIKYLSHYNQQTFNTQSQMDLIKIKNFKTLNIRKQKNATSQHIKLTISPLTRNLVRSNKTLNTARSNLNVTKLYKSLCYKKFNVVKTKYSNNAFKNFQTLALDYKSFENRKSFEKHSFSSAFTTAPGITDFDLKTKGCSSKVKSKAFDQLTTPNYFVKPIKYVLDGFSRSNQKTYLVHRPVIKEGEWVEKGDLLADNSASVQGELCIGQNLYVAYTPWEGYNFEDAVLISDRVISEDLLTTLHIERYEIEVRDTQFGIEKITNNLPNLPSELGKHLDYQGIAKIGTWVQEGDILVGKVAPLGQKKLSPYEKLLYDIMGKQIPTTRDTSLRVPLGVHGRVIHIEILETRSVSQNELKQFTKDTNTKKLKKQQYQQTNLLRSTTTENLKNSPTTLNQFVRGSKPLKLSLKAKKILKNFSNYSNSLSSNDFLVKKFNIHKQNKLVHKNSINYFHSQKDLQQKISKIFLKTKGPSFKLCKQTFQSTQSILTKGLINSKSKQISQNKYDFQSVSSLNKNFSTKHQQAVLKVHVYLAEKRKIQVGDKIAGRHGNKGIVSNILPRQDMPYLPDGTPLDLVLNPLGVPSRMNVGQIFECLLGLAGSYLGQYYKIQPFDEIYGCEASRSLVYSKLYEARIKTGQHWLFDPNFPGKTRLFDGRTGECFHQPVTVGKAYILKLIHQVDEKIHARSTGPYGLVTQQPLRGRSKQGGQRVGEMEVWALEGFGAAYILQELLTVKSDDIKGRKQVMQSILNNKPLSFGTPESFKVLVRELQSLCLDISIYKIGQKEKPVQIDIFNLP